MGIAGNCHLVAALLAVVVCRTMAFVSAPTSQQRTSFCRYNVALNILKDEDSSLESALNRQLDYRAGEADSDFARRFRQYKNAKIRTVAEAFADFTERLGVPVNALYKNIVTDAVGMTHLNIVNARFVRDPIWSLGILTTYDLILKNYPEQDIAKKILNSLFGSIGMNEDEVRAEANMLLDWANGKSREEIASALKGEIDSPIKSVVLKIKEDPFWMYSRYFGIGLVKLMEGIGVEMNADDVYPVMEDWMNNCLGKLHFSACNDSDLFFKVKARLDMMETMMKEIEIREKKRLAQRLEDKAEAALRKAEKEAEMAREIEREGTKQT